MKLLIGLVIVLMSLPSFAANRARLAWIPPTTYIDNTPIIGSIIYRVYQSRNSGSSILVYSTTYTSKVISTGLRKNNNYCWTITAIKNNIESLHSNKVCKRF